MARMASPLEYSTGMDFKPQITGFDNPAKAIHRTSSVSHACPLESSHDLPCPLNAYDDDEFGASIMLKCSCGEAFPSFRAIVWHRSNAPVHAPWHGVWREQIHPNVCLCGWSFSDSRTLMHHISGEVNAKQKREMVPRQAPRPTCLQAQQEITIRPGISTPCQETSTTPSASTHYTHTNHPLQNEARPSRFLAPPWPRSSSRCASGFFNAQEARIARSMEASSATIVDELLKRAVEKKEETDKRKTLKMDSAGV